MVRVMVYDYIAYTLATLRSQHINLISQDLCTRRIVIPYWSLGFLGGSDGHNHRILGCDRGSGGGVHKNRKPFILKHCIAVLLTSASSKYKLRQIHAFSIRHCVPLSSPNMGKHLILRLVSLSGSMAYAHQIFTHIQNPNILTWNTMIRGYAESENPSPALDVYREMRVNSIKPDMHTYPSLLKAVAKILNVREGEKVHSVAMRDGFDSSVFVQNTLVHMYVACGHVESAHKVFELMPVRGLVTWNSVINGFVLNGRPNEALTLYREMGLDGVEPDGFTMVSLLNACTKLRALALGRRTHVFMLKVGLNENSHATNALMDLYAKCGSIREAKKVFDEMEDKCVVSWSTLIVGLAVNGFGKSALDLFKDWERNGLVPNEITFIGVLHACSRCGKVNEGFAYFQRMTEEFGIMPTVEHHGCMVDLLGRAGLLKRAYEYIQSMPMQPNAVIWRTLLGACTMHGDLALEEIARARLLQLEPKHSGDYVLLSNLYASEQHWTNVLSVIRSMLKEGVKKKRVIALSS